MLWRVLIALSFYVFSACAARACDATAPCEIGDGRYFVRAPVGWNGSAALPVVVFFHGYRSSAVQVMADASLGDALSSAGVLLVAPDGLKGAWTIGGRLSTGRDDIAFARAVMADVEKRFPVDTSRRIAAGFSAGGFMTWQLACQAGGIFSAYVAVSGAFLDPLPDDCPTGPVSMLHIHGLADETVPVRGRWIAGGRVRQADVFQSVALMRRVDGCPQRPSRADKRDGLTCEIWSARDCGGARGVELCLHGGGHMFEPRWIVDAVEWARRLETPAP